MSLGAPATPPVDTGMVTRLHDRLLIAPGRRASAPRRSGLVRGLALFVVLAGGGGLAACAPLRADSPSSSPTASTVAPSGAPAVSSTPSSTAPTPAATDVVVPDAPSTPSGQATVTIVNFGADGQSLWASGLVTGAAGTDGTCTLTATASDGRVVSGTIAASATPAAVNCGSISVRATSGEWTLVLSYASSTAAASSAPTTVSQP